MTEELGPTQPVGAFLEYGSADVVGPGEGWPVQTWRDMRAYVGSRVDVLLGAEQDGVPAYRTGILLKLDPDGEFDIRTDDGATWYCWPALSVRPAREESDEEDPSAAGGPGGPARGGARDDQPCGGSDPG